MYGGRHGHCRDDFFFELGHCEGRILMLFDGRSTYEDGWIFIFIFRIRVYCLRRLAIRHNLHMDVT